MRVTSKLTLKGEWLCNQLIHDKHSPAMALSEKKVVVESPSIIQAESCQISLNGLLILDTYMQFSEQTDDYFEIDADSIMMDFMFHGTPCEENLPEEQFRQYSSNRHALRYAPHFKSIFSMKPFEPINYFSIIFSREFYFRLISQHSTLHHEFATRILNRQYAELSTSPLPMNIEMRRVIEDIRNCSRPGELKRIYLEAKIMELLMLQLEQFNHQQLSLNTLPKSILRGGDRDKINNAKKIIEENYIHPPTVKQLALMTGLNEFKLKIAFKECFDTTIYAYVIKLKMEKAYELINEKKMLMREISSYIGYKNPSHFSAAFKTHFGFGPMEIMKGSNQKDMNEEL